MTTAEPPGPGRPAHRDHLLPRGFEPRAELVVAQTRVDRPCHGVLDLHAHLSRQHESPWEDRSPDELLAVMDELDVRCLVDLDGGWGEDVLDAHLARFKEHAPERFICFGGVDWARWPDEGDAFPERAAARLAGQVRRGAEGLKVWKAFGLGVVDQRGRRVRVDDPRLGALWETAASLGVPVLIHVADPPAFFTPLDRHNERGFLLHQHPDWHHVGVGLPSHEALMAEFRSLVASHPRTRFIGAHMACSAGNLAWLGQLLDACPNLSLELSAAVDELGRQPRTARRFFLRYPDRIAFGSDWHPDAAWYRLHYRFLESDDEHFDGPLLAHPGKSWPIYGLDLPQRVLDQVYWGNAARLLGLEAR